MILTVRQGLTIGVVIQVLVEEQAQNLVIHVVIQEDHQLVKEIMFIIPDHVHLPRAIIHWIITQVTIRHQGLRETAVLTARLLPVRRLIAYRQEVSRITVVLQGAV